MSTSIDGVEFDACDTGRQSVARNGVALPTIGLADFRTNKRASGRPQDLADLDSLGTDRPPTDDRPLRCGCRIDARAARGNVTTIVWRRQREHQRTALLRSRLLAVAGQWQAKDGSTHLIARRLVDVTPWRLGIGTVAAWGDCSYRPSR